MTLAQRTFTVVANEKVSGSAHLLRLDGSIEAEAGQFAMIWLPGVGEKPFSLANASPLEFIIEPVGEFSKALCLVEVGSRFTFRGPLGKGFSKEAKRPILLGGGCGAAPLFFLARQFESLGVHPTTVIGAATEEKLISDERWPGSLELTTDDGSRGFRGNCVQKLEELLEKSEYDSIFACGPEAMAVAALQVAEKNNVPIEVSLERYMKCGVGLCGHCAVDPTGWLVCTEGPVASLETCKCLSELGHYHRDAAGRRVPR